MAPRVSSKHLGSHNPAARAALHAITHLKGRHGSDLRSIVAVVKRHNPGASTAFLKKIPDALAGLVRSGALSLNFSLAHHRRRPPTRSRGPAHAHAKKKNPPARGHARKKNSASSSHSPARKRKTAVSHRHAPRSATLTAAANTRKRKQKRPAARATHKKQHVAGAPHQKRPRVSRKKPVGGVARVSRQKRNPVARASRKHPVVRVPHRAMAVASTAWHARNASRKRVTAGDTQHAYPAHVSPKRKLVHRRRKPRSRSPLPARMLCGSSCSHGNSDPHHHSHAHHVHYHGLPLIPHRSHQRDRHHAHLPVRHLHKVGSHTSMKRTHHNMRTRSHCTGHCCIYGSKITYDPHLHI